MAACGFRREALDVRLRLLELRNDDLSLEDTFTSLSLDLAVLGDEVTLHFGLDANSSEEWIAIDNIRFTGDMSPVPVPAAGWLMLSAIAGLTVTGRWRVARP